MITRVIVFSAGNLKIVEYMIERIKNDIKSKISFINILASVFLQIWNYPIYFVL